MKPIITKYNSSNSSWHNIVSSQSVPQIGLQWWERQGLRGLWQRNYSPLPQQRQRHYPPVSITRNTVRVLAPRAALGDNVASDPDTRNQRNGCSGPVRLSDLQGTLQTEHKQFTVHHSVKIAHLSEEQSQGWVGWMTGWGHGRCTTGSWENKTWWGILSNILHHKIMMLVKEDTCCFLR